MTGFPTGTNKRMEADEDVDRVLERCLDRFIDLAPLDDPARLVHLLPNGAQPQHVFILIELIKLDLSLAAEEGQVRRIEWYVDQLGDRLTMDQVPLDLVMEEIQLRREAGERPQPAEYAKRFPRLASCLGSLLESVESTRTRGLRGSPEALSIGSQVDDFIVLRELGRGAFAIVYLARQVSMQRLVALKVSRGKGDESVSLARLDHPNIVRVYDQRLIADGDSHLLYMQYVPGGTLADVIQRFREKRRQPPSRLDHFGATTPPGRFAAIRDGGLILDSVDHHLLIASQLVPESSEIRHLLAEAPWPTAVAWIGVQLASALDAAHRESVLHRDVKPANVLLTAEGIPKLADFNVSLAGAAGRAGAAATFGGSIAYMSPEHLMAIDCRRRFGPVEVGQPADFYSLAVLLWELWQGERPFAARTGAMCWTEAVEEQLQARSRPLRIPDRSGSVSERVLERALRQCLSANPEDRPTSGQELSGRLSLALNPKAAEIFAPELGGWTERLVAIKPWFIIGAVVLVPNIAAGAFNYQYNAREIIARHPELTDTFRRLSFIVNATFFPLGFLIALILMRPIVKAISEVLSGRPANDWATHQLMSLGRRAALVGGCLWILGGCVFAVVLSRTDHDFPRIEAVHFVMSMLICGGVAAVYPYFGVTALATHLYYPVLVRRSLQDASFDHHAEAVRLSSSWFLIQAALIPMLAIVLLISRDVIAKDVILVAVGASALGLFGSFWLYQRIVAAWETMGEILSAKRNLKLSATQR